MLSWPNSPLQDLAPGGRGLLTLRSCLIAAMTLASGQNISDLHLFQIAPQVPARPLAALILTGDGGWGPTDRGIASALAQAGIGSMGWSALRYFWRSRDPDEAARDLARILRYEAALFHTDRYVLIGYSFGASALPSMVQRLPPDLRRQVALVALLGPGKRAEFRFHLGDWFGHDTKDSRPLLPEIGGLSGLNVLCSSGASEADSVCRRLDPSKFLVLVRPVRTSCD